MILPLCFIPVIAGRLFMVAAALYYSKGNILLLHIFIMVSKGYNSNLCYAIYFPAFCISKLGMFLFTDLSTSWRPFVVVHIVWQLVLKSVNRNIPNLDMQKAGKYMA
jgi:hypothetical protein